MSYDLEKDVFRLLISEPFFAGISRHVQKSANKSVPTAGVRVTEDGRFELVYNPDFMEKLDDKFRRGILKHEFYHLILHHCLGRSPDGRKISKRWNFATDMSINTHLKGEIPECGVFPHKFNYPDGLTAEEYYNRLKDENKGEGDDKCDGKHSGGEGGDNAPSCDGSCGNIDSHEGWGEGNIPEEIKEIAKERLREALRDAAKDANRSSNGWGNIPADIRKEVMRFINGTVDWRAILRMFIGQSQRAYHSNTIKRINRRYPYIHPGRKVNHSAHIAISIDQSGSVSDELLSLFYAELDSLAKLASFTIVPFDTRVGQDKIYIWKKGERRNHERVMCGGTNFDAPTEYVNNNRQFDGHIILTDMQAPAPKPSRVRRMWMTDMEGAENPYFKTNERVIPIKRKVT